MSSASRICHAVNMDNPPDSTMYVAGFRGPHMQAAQHCTVMHPLSISKAQLTSLP